MHRPKGWPLYRDLAGRKFRLLYTLKNGHGDVFPAGTVMEAGSSPTWSGMSLTNTKDCPCGMRHSIRRVDPSSVELLPIETKLPVLEDCQRASTCGNKSDGRHSCPYQADINDNGDEDYCNCCSDCTTDCAMDI